MYVDEQQLLHWLFSPVTSTYQILFAIRTETDDDASVTPFSFFRLHVPSLFHVSRETARRSHTVTAGVGNSGKGPEHFDDPNIVTV